MNPLNESANANPVLIPTRRPLLIGAWIWIVVASYSLQTEWRLILGWFGVASVAALVAWAWNPRAEVSVAYPPQPRPRYEEPPRPRLKAIGVAGFISFLGVYGVTTLYLSVTEWLSLLQTSSA